MVFVYFYSDPFAGIHPNYQSTAKSLKRKVRHMYICMCSSAYAI